MLGLDGMGPDVGGGEGQLGIFPEQKPKRNAKRFYCSRIILALCSSSLPHLHLFQTKTKDTLIEGWQTGGEKREVERK